MKVSTYRQEITPSGQYFPCYLSGHAIRTQIADGIIDPLYVTCNVLDFDTTKLVIATIELIGIDREVTEDIRHMISDKYNIPYNQVYICYVHTHSAPECRLTKFFANDHRAVDGYIEFYKQVTIDIIEKALAQPGQQVEVYSSVASIEGCYCNRNGKDKPCDKDVTLIEFREGNQVVAGLVNFTCHSTVLGPQNLKVSSDLAGYVARSFENKFGVYPTVVIGAAGDMSNRLYRQGNDLNELNRVGKEMMDQVFSQYNPVKLHLTAPVVTEYTFDETYIPEKEKKQKQYDDIKSKIDNAKSFDETKVYTSALAMAEKGLECKPFRLDMQCYYVNLGDLRFFVIPCELFSRFGITIKQTMNGQCNFIMGYCNYSCGYLGNIDDYGASFETAASDIPVGTTERLVDQIVEVIKKANKE